VKNLQHNWIQKCFIVDAVLSTLEMKRTIPTFEQQQHQHFYYFFFIVIIIIIIVIIIIIYYYYIIFIYFLCASAMLKHVIDIGWTSVCPSVRPSVCHTLALYQNG